MFCVTIEYKVTLTMRTPIPLRAEPYRVGLESYNAKGPWSISFESHSKQRNG